MVSCQMEMTKKKIDEGNVVLSKTRQIDSISLIGKSNVSTVCAIIAVFHFSPGCPRHCLYCCCKFAFSTWSPFWREMSPRHLNHERHFYTRIQMLLFSCLVSFSLSPSPFATRVPLFFLTHFSITRARQCVDETEANMRRYVLWVGQVQFQIRACSYLSDEKRWRI